MKQIKREKCILLVLITQIYHDARSTECQKFSVMKKPTERFPTYVCQSRADLLLCSLDVGNMQKQTYAMCVPVSCVMYDGRKKKKSRDKSRYEEHQKLSCKISPLVFYFKANNKKMRGVAAITVPWRQGHTAPHPAKQTSEAARREICDDKETNDDAAKDKRVAECSLSSYFFPVHFSATNSRRTLILLSNACRI